MIFDSLIRSVVVAALNFSNDFSWLVGAFGGFCFVLSLSSNEETKKTAGFWLFGAVAAGPFLWWLLPHYLEVYEHLSVPVWRMWVFGCAGILGGAALPLILMRSSQPLVDKFWHRFTKKSSLARPSRIDVKTIDQHLPTAGDSFNAEKYLDLSKGIFVGLDSSKTPLYIPLSEFQKRHTGITGSTGMGKGVMAGLLCRQALMAGEAVICVDPKSDEWAPHVLRDAAEKAGKRFLLVDLRVSEFAIDLLAGCGSDEFYEILVNGLELGDRGEAADHFQRHARLVAWYAAHLGFDSIFSLSQSAELGEHGIKDGGGLEVKIKELARVKAISGVGGVNLAEAIEQGDCVYVIGDTTRPEIVTAQKMITARVLQIARARDRITSKPRHVCLFLDEFRYQLSRLTVEALGTIRDKNVHIILTHQAIADLRACPADCDPDSVVAAVVENCSIRLVYRVVDPKTAEWLSAMTGQTLVDDETRYLERNPALVESLEGKRMIREAPVPLVEPSVFHYLPEGVGLAMGVQRYPVAVRVCPILVNKMALSIYRAPVAPAKTVAQSTTPNSLAETIDIG